METLESERLILRPFTLADDDFILELLNTEGWIRYIGDRNVRTKDQAITYLEKGPLKTYQTSPIGLGLVQLKSNARAIGMCGLIRRDYLDSPDLGFAFLPEYMGKGYAGEIARKVIDHGLNQLQLERIFAITLPANSSSVRLLKRLGFMYEKNFVSDDTQEELSLFSISRNQHSELVRVKSERLQEPG